MKKVLIGSLVALTLLVGFSAREIVAQSCTLTTNLGLCKGARGSAEWDTFLNSNFDLIDSQAINTGATAQTKTGILTLSSTTPLKLTGTGFQANDVIFLDSVKSLARSSSLQWTGTQLTVGSASITSAGAVTLTGLLMASGAGAGKVLTSDGSGNGTWQTVAGASSGWTPGTGKVTLTTATDEVGINVASPTEKLEVGGGVKIGSAATTQAGVIQWTGSHFQGYTGSSWANLDEASFTGGGWTDSGTDIAITTSTDKVGIGAVSPNTKLTVVGIDEITYYAIQSLTGSSLYPFMSGLVSWNTSASPTLIHFTLNDTASGASSKLMDFIVSGSEKFALRKDGQLTLAAGLIATTGTFSGALSAASITLTSGASSGYVLTSDGSGNASWQAAAGGSGVPSGMIAVFDTSCPSGWTRVSAFDNKFVYGGSSYGATGGAATHTHDVNPASFNTDTGGSHGHTVPMGTFTTGLNSTYETVSGTPADKNIADNDHSHEVTITDRTITSSGSHNHAVDVPNTTSGSGSSLPPYITVVYCKKD